MKNKKLILILSAALAALLASGCVVRWGGRIRGDGNVINQERPVSAFSGIAVSGAGNISIRHAETSRVVVRTDSNVQDLLETKVEGDTLRIGFKNNLGSFNPTELAIDIYTPELTSINVSGAAKIKIEDGKTASLNMNISGACTIEAENFEAQNVSISLSGASSVKLWATGALDYNISGVGNVRYRGSPSLNGRISGVGNIRPL